MIHPFEPVFDENSRLLILGSFPSVRSRETGFYYGHERNRFWAVTAAVFGCEAPRSKEEKIKMLLSNGIALWDAAASCEIIGSSDASISSAVPNDVGALLSRCEIRRVFANGATAGKIYHRLIEPVTGMKITVLPSTSPANAAFSLERLTAEWRVIAK